MCMGSEHMRGIHAISKNLSVFVHYWQLLSIPSSCSNCLTGKGQEDRKKVSVTVLLSKISKKNQNLLKQSVYKETSLDILLAFLYNISLVLTV